MIRFSLYILIVMGFLGGVSLADSTGSLMWISFDQKESIDHSLSLTQGLSIAAGGKLSLSGYGFSLLAPLSEIVSIQNLKPALSPSSFFSRDIPDNLVGLPLVYPSPVRMGLGAEIGYYLKTNRAIEIRVYDMAGQLVFSKQCLAGLLGGQKGYNTVPLSNETVNYTLSAGVYFVLVMADGKVLGKTKFAIIP